MLGPKRIALTRMPKKLPKRLEKPMSTFPFISNFQGDFVLQLVVADLESSMDEVAATAAHHSVGKRVAPQPGKDIRVRKAGTDKFFPQKMKVTEAGLKPMDCLEFLFVDPE